MTSARCQSQLISVSSPKVACLVDKEILGLENDKLENVRFECKDDIICILTAPKDSVYAGENLKVRFTFSEYYPNLPPRVVFIPPIIPRHKDIDESGRLYLYSIPFRSKCEIRKICEYILKIMHFTKINYLQWKPNEPAPACKVDPSFEVPNGLSGMGLIVLLRLLGLITTKSDTSQKDKNTSIRSVVGVSQEHVRLKNHTFFRTCRSSIQIEVWILGAIKRITLTVRPTDSIQSVKERAAEVEGVFITQRTPPPVAASVPKKNEKKRRKERNTPQPALGGKETKRLTRPLYDGGTLLEDTRPCYYYRLEDKNRSFLSVRSIPSLPADTGHMRIVVATMVGRSCVLAVRETDRLWRVWEMLVEELGIPVESIRLVRLGMPLKHAEVSLRDYDIRNNDVLQLMVGLRG